MAGYRVNERNSGNWTLDGEPKKRAAKQRKVKLEAYQLDLIQQVLQKVNDSLQQEDGVYTDGGRFLISLNQEQKWDLNESIEKLKIMLETELNNIANK